jgi:hypothetical protein
MQFLHPANSYESKTAQIGFALDRFLADALPSDSAVGWVEHTFDDYIVAGVAAREGKHLEYWEMPYQIDGDVVSFGAPEPVAAVGVIPEHAMTGSIEFATQAKAIARGLAGKEARRAGRAVIAVDEETPAGSRGWLTGWYDIAADGALQFEGKSLPPVESAAPYLAGKAIAEIPASAAPEVDLIVGYAAQIATQVKELSYGSEPSEAIVSCYIDLGDALAAMGLLPEGTVESIQQPMMEPKSAPTPETDGDMFAEYKALKAVITRS